MLDNHPTFLPYHLLLEGYLLRRGRAPSYKRAAVTAAEPHSVSPTLPVLSDSPYKPRLCWRALAPARQYDQRYIVKRSIGVKKCSVFKCF